MTAPSAASINIRSLEYAGLIFGQSIVVPVRTALTIGPCTRFFQPRTGTASNSK
jgi:hypothetical protein